MKKIILILLFLIVIYLFINTHTSCEMNDKKEKEDEKENKKINYKNLNNKEKINIYNNLSITDQGEIQSGRKF